MDLQFYEGCMRKPIKVFWSPLGNRFYASQYYKSEKSADGKKMLYEITGEKFDVTNDIAHAVMTNDIEFRRIDGNKRNKL